MESSHIMKKRRIDLETANFEKLLVDAISSRIESNPAFLNTVFDLLNTKLKARDQKTDLGDMKRNHEELGSSQKLRNRQLHSDSESDGTELINNIPILHEYEQYLPGSEMIHKKQSHEDFDAKNKCAFRTGPRYETDKDCFRRFVCNSCDKQIKGDSAINRAKHCMLHKATIYLCPYGPKEHACPIVHHKQEHMAKHIEIDHQNKGFPIAVNYRKMTVPFIALPFRIAELKRDEDLSAYRSARDNYLQKKQNILIPKAKTAKKKVKKVVSESSDESDDEPRGYGDGRRCKLEIFNSYTTY